ncbi:uncharacterized protein FIBRA_08071 [Fibroporia radiculosa]|uniref:DUF6699 domain-containing protein n=1 Tax=Fibroporia radiculosa TaxID=599839 RepID=J4GW54_9APHY|nr:uncharacterized protein FIBRA_08071 [Fibroporia radiculosa]CCM05835.1 predicted protein [Fibroporia radiculosa]
MHYPNTPSSSGSGSGSSHRSRVPQAPNAPYMNPRDLPPSPQTPSTVLSGRGLPPSTPYMHSVGLPTPPAQYVSHGLMTPPTTPVRPRGSGAATQMHALLSVQPPLYFDISRSPEEIQVYAPRSSRSLSESATQPGTTCVVINVIDVFAIQVRAQPGASVTVAEVLSHLAHGMARQAEQHEISCFPPAVQDHVIARCQISVHGRKSSFIKRVDLLGPRVIFAGLEVTNVAAGVVYCDVRLLARGSR